MGILFTFLFCVVTLILLVVGFLFYKMSQMPNPPYQVPPKRIDPAQWDQERVTVGWIGHSTVLIQFYGIRIITDPVLTERIGIPLGWGDNWKMGPKRHTSPAIDVEGIEPVDVVLLSHAHMDHLDLSSLRKVVTSETVIITTSGISHLLRKLGAKEVRELDGKWDNMVLSNGLVIQAIPVVHWGKRYPWSRKQGYTGFLLSYRDKKIFYPGDTAYTDVCKELPRWGEIDLAFMPIGAYEPASFQVNHCTPEQAWKMFVDSGAKKLVPIHWNTFVLSFEPVEEPLERLIDAAQASKKEDCVVIRELGEMYVLDEVETGRVLRSSSEQVSS
ncbi:MBL fold metallo-hydrolase [Thermoactinomyces sp. DSM 45892]|uniref:MBL fold metallo-hydrolase n=1 Tax=Thermoactinomyces sp. DSM 45892 TaxID=1882753 RepID=UPI0008989968|nr:MBL fold metallo-hydrolase [Thermoactinomyces sp. DSM 45892]SDZ37346.1 L-ascorbate metabolism protein UlaG, beta-lactamase superfamily [Thermoactinomyces sp. DSM 45892]